MRNYRIFLAAMSVAVLGLSGAACTSGKEPSQKAQEASRAYRKAGLKLAGEAQKSLMAEVKKALQEGGPVHAVDYCHVEAKSILDQESKKAGVEISRVARRNRNPQNNLETEAEQEAFRQLEKLAPRFDTSLVEQEGERYVFYKPIPLGMPACLKCHGEPEKEVAPETLAALAERYPEDQALHFALGELRGAWKITFPPEFVPEN